MVELISGNPWRHKQISGPENPASYTRFMLPFSYSFDEIDHSRLLAEVEMLVTDPAILRLIRMWLAADVVDGKQRFRLHKGVPQGSPLSPLLANLYLDQLDEAMLDQDLRLVRFADDFLILCRHKKGADKALEFTADVLESLRLQLNPAKTQVVDFNHGFRFLGVEFVRSLAIKAKYPAAVPISFDLQTLAEIPAVPPPLPAERKKQLKASMPKSEMALAFAEAGIQADDFPDQVEQVMPLNPPVEDKTDRPPAELDPRLRTLYVLEHGYTLGKESERFGRVPGHHCRQRCPQSGSEPAAHPGRVHLSRYRRQGLPARQPGTQTLYPGTGKKDECSDQTPGQRPAP